MAINIYVGPNNKKLGLRQYQTFVGPVLPDHVQSALKANPAIANDFMTLDRFQTLVPPGAPRKQAANPNQAPARQGPPIKNLK